VTYCTKVSLERKSKILLLQHLSTQSSAFDITYCKAIATFKHTILSIRYHLLQEKKLAHKFSFLENTEELPIIILRRKKRARAVQHTPHTPLNSELHSHLTVADQQCTRVATWVALCSPHSMLVSMTGTQSFGHFLACCPPWLFPNPLATIWPSGTGENAQCCTH
jgi:hypothetical protein